MPAPTVVSPFSTSADRPADGPVTCRPVATTRERDLVWRIRHEVFVLEQAFFEGSDRDARDACDTTIHVVGLCGDVAVGTVRLYPLDDAGLWQGDRLAVLPAYRHHHVGAPLVRYAVASAAAAGGWRMIAHVQVPNVAFFQRLGWRPDGAPETYVGHPHQRMLIDLQR